MLIEEGPRSGAANMAIDQAIAEACAAGESPPTLRFYQWDPPAVSLGRHQAIAEINVDAIDELGYEVVRRSTGGRAILHIDELTYSVAAPKDEYRVGGGVMDSYLRMSHALLEGLQLLGVVADKAEADVRAGKDVSAACFEVPSAYEITAKGRKLMGSAQSRRAGYVLQHGSLPLKGDITRLIPLLALPPESAYTLQHQLKNQASTLAQALGTTQDDLRLTFQNVASSLARGFRHSLNLILETPRFDKQLTSLELRRSAELIREKYANPEWTFNR
ncbi:lipoate--protein ligase family protein [Chloroflexi bacterium TSY]|nr:lipoate--protein ligase family protein [Chloroflexi bacterium TSY]